MSDSPRLVLTKLQMMQCHIHAQDGVCPEWIAYKSQHQLSIDCIEANAGLFVVALAKFYGANDGNEIFEFDPDGVPTVVIEAILFDQNREPYVADLVAWPLHDPAHFATALGANGGADVLSVVNMIQRGGAPLSVHQTTQGHRFQRDPQPWARPAIEAYGKVILDLLQRKPRTIGDNELDPAPLSLSAAAISVWRSFADEMERSLAAEGLSSGIRGLRNKVPEMALRIAGILVGIEGAGEVTADTLQRAMLIATFFLSEAKRLYEAAMTRPEIARAEKLLRWMVVKNIDQISLRDILVTGPTAFRDADAVKSTGAILVAHSLCRIETHQTGGRPSERLFLSPYAASILQ